MSLNWCIFEFFVVYLRHHFHILAHNMNNNTNLSTIKLKLWSLCLLLLTATPARAASRMIDEHLLSSNLITALCQDRQGYLWIGTEYGLNRFDGEHVTQFYSDDSVAESLSDDIVRLLMTDRDGKVWVLTNRGAQRYNRLTNGFESIKFEKGTSANINDILQTPEGNIWLLSAKSGVYEVDDNLQAHPLAFVNPYIHNTCNNFYLDSKRRLWIASQGRGLLMIDTKTEQTTYFEALTDSIFSAIDIAEDRNQVLTVLSTNAILQFDERKLCFEKKADFTQNTVYRMCFDSSGNLMFGTSGNGLWNVDLTAGTAQKVRNPDFPNLVLEKVRAFLKDQDGNLWIGCYQKGLLMVSDKETPFHYVPLRQIETNNGNPLRSVFADQKGHVYICQEKGGIADIDREGNCRHQWMKDYTVMSIHEDNEGSLWVGTYRNGLFRISHPKESGTRTPEPEWFAQTGTQRIGSIAQDKQGNIYTAVFGNGIHSYTPDGKTERPLCNGQPQLKNIYLNKLFTDSNGWIWIGHYYGIDVYDPNTDSMMDLKVHPALRPAIVYAIAQTPDHAVWIGSNKGLFRYDGQWKRYTTADGLPNNIICGLVVAADSTLWVSTFRGLGKLEAGGNFTSFYHGNGLQEWSYSRGIYANSSHGEAIFGHQNGITWFTPQNIEIGNFDRNITLTGMRLGDIDVNTTTLSNGKAVITSPIEETESIKVSYLDNTFSLTFSPMDFRDAQNICYEYRFNGEPGSQWHRTSNGVSEIFLSRLSIGSHQLQVRAYDNGARSAVKTLYILVSPPWYRSWMAYTLYLLLLAGIIALWWRNYWNRRQAETNEEKIRFFVDISHELRSPLTLIKTPLEQLLGNSHDAATTRALRNMERNTNRLLTLTHQILSIRKIEKGQMTLHYAETRLGDFIADICHDFDYQAEERQLHLNFSNQAPDLTVWIDPDQFDKVVYNLIGNAIKYAKDGGEIEISLRQTSDGQAEFCVRDNGPGIDEAQLRKIFERFYQASARPATGQMSYGIGLNLTRKIIDLHGGSIIARNRSDAKGSEFIVYLKTGNKHLPQEQLVATDSRQVQPFIDEASGANNKDQGIRSNRKKTSYRIIVVDDDEDICDFLQTELGESYFVQTFTDSQKALECITDSLPDLVISDVVMPNLDGFELLRLVKSNTKTSHIPVILLTTQTDHQSRIKGLEKKADAYMDKPFNLEELEVRITGLIANRNLIRGKFSGLQEQASTVRQIEVRGNDEVLLEKIMKAINSRLDDSNYNVEALAEDVGLSRAQLHRRMKELTGISAGEFIRNLRMQQAAKLLESGDITISQVTYATGFSSPAHFTSVFKKHFGVTPSEYMAKHTGNHH